MQISLTERARKKLQDIAEKDHHKIWDITLMGFG